MTSLSFTFKVRKLSTYRDDGSWFHFPQRADISVNFFKLRMDPAITTTVAWKGTTLDKFVIEPDVNVVSVISKYPSIGYKLTNPFGKLVKRFQISFGDHDEFDRCSRCIRDDLHLNITDHNTERPGDVASWYEATQLIQQPQEPDNVETCASQQAQYSQKSTNPSRQGSQNPYTDPELSQADSQYYQNSQATQNLSQIHSTNQTGPTPTNTGYQTSTPFTSYSAMAPWLQQATMVPQLMPPNQQFAPAYQHLNPIPFAALPRNDHPLQVLSLIDLSNSELKELLQKKLKDKNFLDLVKKVEGVLEDLS